MAEQMYFEDVKEGYELPPIKIAPDKAQLVKFAAGSGDFNPLHFDENFPMLKPRTFRNVRNARSATDATMAKILLSARSA